MNAIPLRLEAPNAYSDCHMHKRLPCALFALIFQTAILPAASPTDKQTVFFVTQSKEAGWQDFAYLAAIPASRVANKGNGAVIVLEQTGGVPREVDDYLQRLKPQGLCHVGTKPLAPAPPFGACQELPCASADQAAVALANAFWSKAPRVVLCREDDYASALMASTLAARLGVPLFFCANQGPSPEAVASIRRLKASELLFVGEAPARIKVTSLPDIGSVMAWLKQQGIKTPYLALVNVRDRTGTTVRKLSLAAPLLAAARGGMVYPFDAPVSWRVPFTGKPISGNLPKGIPTGAKPPNAGVIDLPEGKVSYVLGFVESEKDRQLFLDLDGNGAFDGAGEGPFAKNGVFTILGKSRALDLAEKHGSNCDVSVSTGSAEEFIAPLRALYAKTGIPRYLCIVGFPDAIPLAIVSHGHGDVTSDLPYANTDDDLFSEIAVGRIIAESAAFATLHVSRTITYQSLLDRSWAARAGQAQWENGLNSYFENVGVDATAYHGKEDLPWLEKPSEDGKNKGKRASSFGQDSPLASVAFISHSSHSSWFTMGDTYDAKADALLAPAVVESSGCATCNLEYARGFQSFISRLFRNGAVSFSGQTDLGIAHQEQQRIEYWNAVTTGASIGDAHCHAQNSKASLVIETGQGNGGPDFYQLQIRSLFGDPAFKPYIPSRPRSAPAKSELRGDVVTVQAPAVWNKVQILVPEDWKQWANKPLYILRGLGTYPNCHWCKEEYDKEEYFINAEVTTTREIKSIKQKQQPPAPLGWNGKFTVDKNPDGSRTYRWRVRLIDFDQTTGTITNRIDRIEYQLN